jgi:uncharacterized protein
MLIDVRTLTRQTGSSLDLELERSPEAFSLCRDDLAVDTSVAFSGQLLHTDHGILVLNGTLRATLTGNCARCLQPIPLTIETGLHETFQPAAELLAEGEDRTDEAYAYIGNMLDADQALRDNLIPLLPARLICSDDCAGICPTCGNNRNTSPCDCLTADKGRPSPFATLKQLL